MKATTTWKSGMAFEAKIRGHHFLMDTQSFGGNDLGPTPKETLIASVLGCTGMDVVALLKKNRIALREFSLTGNGEPRNPHPKVFSQLDLVYDLKVDFQNAEVELPKVVECVQLSMTKYCPVSAMVSATSPIFFTVVVNGEIEYRGEAEFDLKVD